MRPTSWLLPLAAILPAASALAQGTGAMAQDTGGGPVPICTDRPTKGNATCTVPVGRVQLETTGVGWTRFDMAGARTDNWTVGASTIKFGLTHHSDLQIGFTPLVDVRTRDSGSDHHVSGVGDVTVRYKHRLTGPNSAAQIALIPFVKLPTARIGIGNRKVEGGLAVPVSLAVGSATLTAGPELDLLADDEGKGHHVALVNLVNFAVPAAARLTLVGEVWTVTNFDPAGTITLVSADGAVAYAVNDDLQLDLGANLGLNRNTPDVEIYAGLSVRF